MKSRFFVLFICLLATVTMVGCGGSGSSSDVITPATATIKGVVSDSLAPTTYIAANITDGTNTTTSSAVDGTFTLSNVAIGAGKVTLTIDNSSYLTGYSIEPVTAGNTTNTNISLINRTGLEAEPMTTGDLTTAGESLTFPISKVKIDFPKNSVVNANGPVAAPTVSVVYKAPPKTADTLNVFPGIFAGIPTGATTEIPFETFGFVNVDLGAGNSLDPAIGASLTIPLGTNNPPVGDPYELVMPLWRFDDTDGIWKQVATATRASIAEPFSAHVTTFSWYNLDAPVNVSRLDVIIASYTSDLKEWEVMEGTATDTDRTNLAKRIAGANVVVTTTSGSAGEGQWGVQAYDGSDTFTWRDSKLTDSNGVASFKIPADRKFSIKVGDKSAYMYEVTNGVATAFINMGSYATHEAMGDTQ